MALLEILHHPDPRLREKAQTVSDFGQDLQRLIDDMFETMYDAPGVGLAATQVGVALQVAVMDCGADEQREPRVMINPEIIETDEPEVVDEGCLSVPEVSDRVRRFRRVRLRALDRDGNPYELEADGLLAQCIQHEKDHLDGKLYIDHLSSIKRDRLLKRQRKLRKQEG
ncbi:peptide deformylase [Algiphilus sp.]|uniref:peptide deformylase n=1 Tax=Algiphilus sp. TaxID=1872431 RepID=UPI003B52172A